MWAPYGLAVSHHQSHFASLVRTISFLIRTSTDESAGGAQKPFDSTRHLRIGRNACCMPTIQCVSSKSVVELKDSRTLRRQNRGVAMADILFVHARISHKSDKKGSSIRNWTAYRRQIKISPIW